MEQNPVAKGPRLIDMDILLYGAETIDTPNCRCHTADASAGGFLAWCRWRDCP